MGMQVEVASRRDSPDGGYGKKELAKPSPIFRKKIRLVPYLMLLPSVAVVLLFAYYPAITSLYMGFFRWDGFNPPTFSGFSNFVSYIDNPHFGQEMFNLGVLLIGGVIHSLVMPFLAAQLLFSLKHSVGRIYRPIVVIPMVVPPIIVFEIWGNIFNPQTGLLNELFTHVGLSGLTNTWLSNPNMAIFCLLFVGFPWMSNLYLLIYLAGLQNIPSELFEAFALERQSWFSRFVHVDIPLMKGQFRLVAIFAIIGAIQNFVLPLVLTQGGPGYSTMVPGLEMYNDAFSYDQYGAGMAIGSLMFVVILFFTLLVFRTRTKGDDR